MAGMFVHAASKAGWFQHFAVELQLRDRLYGGVPKDPKIIESWLAHRMGLDKVEELRVNTIRTMQELGYEVDPDSTLEMLRASAAAHAAMKNTNGFKQDEKGLYIESRQIKAMLKEATNIVFAGMEKWGPSGKGPKSFFAERAHVGPLRIHLGKQEPDGLQLFVGHVTGPQGPQSNLTHYEYVEGIKIRFVVKSLKYITRAKAKPAKASKNGKSNHDVEVETEGKEIRNEVDPEKWPIIWTLAEENGLGSLRSQDGGKFDIVRFEEISYEQAVEEFGGKALVEAI